MISKFTRELIVIGLLLVTLCLILANQFLVRSVELNVHNVSGVHATDDRNEGGKSKSAATIDGDVFRFEYATDSVSFPNPYTTISIHPNKGFGRNLSWFEDIRIKIRSNKPGGEQLLLQVRTFEPSITCDEDGASMKYNQALLKASNAMETVVVKRDEFHVPTWWRNSYSAKGDASYPSFKDIHRFEFSTLGDVGKGEFEIASINCTGHWIDTATLNQGLLWLWMSAALIRVITRVRELNKTVNEKTAVETELLQHNSLLESESATYQELARRDPLTGLFNRYGLEGKFEELSSAGEFPYTIILFDLDKFKQINDIHGHNYGDRVLFDVAKNVKSRTGDSDIVARLGGDEFLIVLNGQNKEQAADFAEEIRQEVLNSDLVYTCSFGISESEAGESFETTLGHADGSLYESKDDANVTKRLSNQIPLTTKCRSLLCLRLESQRVDSRSTSRSSNVASFGLILAGPIELTCSDHSCHMSLETGILSAIPLRHTVTPHRYATEFSVIQWTSLTHTADVTTSPRIAGRLAV